MNNASNCALNVDEEGLVSSKDTPIIQVNVNGVNPDTTSKDMNKDKTMKPHGLEITTHEDEDRITPGNVHDESAAISNMANDEEAQAETQQQDTMFEQYTKLQTARK